MRAFASSMIGLLTVGTLFAAPTDGCPRTIYLSVGDHQDLLWVPLDSKVSVETAFDTLRDRYQAERIWWRGGQDEVWGKQFVLRPENRLYDHVWRWWKHLQYEKVGTNRIAVKAARDRGLKIWMAYGLFDNGSSADVAFRDFPYAAEDRLRVEHPEYAPVNRWGTWRQGGPVEFAYPGARKGMVDYLTKHLVAGGYDGVAFLTYAENYSQRYDDEFGFNEPIVAEFKKRHGVDIRTQAFDKQAWSRLRGESLTEFFRELRASLKKHGVQVAVCVDGKNPELPTLWSDVKARTAGVVHMDVATWAKEGLVDEINVWAPPDDAAAALVQCQKLCQGTMATATAFRTRGLLPAGTPRVMFLGGDFENGFPWESWIDFRDEKIPPQPTDALENGDRYARRQLLTAVLKKKQTLPTGVLTGATKDADLYVRRLALRALAAAGDPAALPAVEAALRDPEHAVRWQAALTLGNLAGAKAIAPLFDAIARDPVSYQLRFVAVPEALKRMQAAGKVSAKDKEPILARLSDANPVVREAALFALVTVGAPATPAAETALLRVAANDPSAHAREMALINLRSTFGPAPKVLAAARTALADKDDAIAIRALAVLAALGASPSAAPRLREETLAEASAFFRRYGDGCSRTDKEWGWRIAGAALLGFGAAGEKVLHTLMEEKKDRRLAELAWIVVYIRQEDRYHRGSEAEDRKAHARHPFLPVK